MINIENLKKQKDEEIFKDVENKIVNELLENRKENLEFEIALIRRTMMNDIYVRAMSSKNEKMRLVGEAFGHLSLKIKPTTEKLGYVLAELEGNFDFDGTDNELFIEMTDKYDFRPSKYIYATTHYDTCDNGYYFRWS